MKKIIKLYAIAILCLGAVVGCDDEDNTGDSGLNPTSPTVGVIGPSALADVDYDATTDTEYEFSIELSEAQITDVKVWVNVEGTGVEDEDFELSAHSLTIAASETSSSKLVLTMIGDAVRAEDRAFKLVFGDENTSNATISPVSYDATLKASPDVILNPPAASTIDFTLWWELTDSDAVVIDDICDYIDDLDITFQTQGSDLYDDDLMGFGLASTNCPEEGSLTIAGMNDGEVYDAFLAFYAGADFGDLGDITVHLDFSRANSDFEGTVSFERAFSSNMPSGAYYEGIMTIERNGDVVTLKNSTGIVLGEGMADVIDADPSKACKIYTGTKK